MVRLGAAAKELVQRRGQGLSRHRDGPLPSQEWPLDVWSTIHQVHHENGLAMDDRLPEPALSL